MDRRQLMNAPAANYAAACERALYTTAEATRRTGSSIDALRIDGLAKLIARAQHFVLPDGGCVFDDQLKGLAGIEPRLPYPLITVSYHMPANGQPADEYNRVDVPRRVNVALEIERATELPSELDELKSALFKCGTQERYLVVLGVGEYEGFWQPYVVGWYVNPAWDDYSGVALDPPYPAKPACSKIAGRALIFLPQAMDAIAQARGGGDLEKVMPFFLHDIGGEVGAVLELCEALTCSNVRPEPVQRADPALNARRLRAGKLPLYEVKTLMIDVPRAQGSTAPGQSDGTRASPRQHLRRGHIRRLDAERKIWVNSAVIGDPARGRVGKTYVTRHEN